MSIETRIQHKRDTASNWATANLALLDGEIIVVNDNGKRRLKVGTGATYSSTDFLDADAAAHIANTGNPHGVTKAQLDLGNVDNTADANKTVKAAGALTVVSKGSATKPVYFNASGVPVACTYSLNADVPSGAKFTDTVYTHPSHTAKSSGLYKITVDSLGHVSSATAVAKSDITGLGIPAQDTVYTHPSTHAASMITGLATVATSGSYNDLSNKPTIPTSLPANGGNSDTVNGHTVLSDVPEGAVFTDTIYTLPNATTSTLGGVKVGTNISVSSGTISVANGSTSTKGVVKLSSSTSSTSTSLAATASAVKAAYDLASGKQDPATTLSGYGITDAYTKTEVDTKVSSLVDSAPEALNTLNELAAALGDDPNFATTISTAIGKKANTDDLAKVATSGSYNDLSNKPTIPTSLPANGGNAATVGGFTVGTNVPANAVFTDTVYTHPTYTAKSSGLYKITVNSLGHVSAATAVAKSDITGLGIPAQDTTYSAASTSAAGLMSAADKTKLDGIATGANAYSLPTASSSTLGGVKTTSTVTSTSGLTACPIISGVPYYKNTTYSAATTSANGLMSSSDKSKLDGIASGANAYTHPSHTAKSSGLYKITVDALGHVSAATAVAKADITGLGIPAQDTVYTHPATHAASMITGLATVATSGSYNDLSNKPTIPAITKVTFTATDSKWGALANGRYPLTISASGGEFLNCYRTNGSNYDKMDVNVTVSGNNIIIYSLDKFAGYMTYLK